MRNAIWILFFLITSGSGFAAEWEAYVHSNDVNAIWADNELLFWGSTCGAVIETLSTAGQYKIHTANSSLKSNQITAVAMDASGRLWIGTDGRGLAMRSANRWELFSATTYSLPSDNVTAITTYGNTVVVGTSIGVARFIDGRLSDYYVGEDWDYEGDDRINSVAVNMEMMLVGTNNGLFKLDLDEMSWSQVHQDTIASIDYDGKGKFWFIAVKQRKDREIYRFDGTTKEKITRDGIGTALVRNISASGDTVWIATEWGPRRMSMVDNRWLNESRNLTLKQQDCYTIHVSRGGKVWLATRDSSVAEFVETVAHTAWVFHKSDGPAGNYVEDIAVDIEGNVWFATGERGFKPQVRGIDIGILMFDGKNWNRYGRGYDILTSDIAYRIESNPVDRSIWVAYWDAGLVRYGLDDCKWTSHQKNLKSKVVSDVYVDRKGRVFFGQYKADSPYGGGIGVLDPKSGTLIFYQRDDTCMKADYVTAIGPGPSGSCMTGNYAIEGEDEVHLIDIGDTVHSKTDDYCTSWPAATNYIGGYCHDISLDSTNIAWLGTDGGLSAFDPGSQKWYRVTWQIGKVFDIEVDKYNRKWVATDRGLWTLTKVGKGLAPEDFMIDLYNNSNSPLPPLPVLAIEFDDDGYLWIGTDNAGIFRLKPEKPDTTGPVVPLTTPWVDVYPNPYDFRKNASLGFVGCKPGTRVTIYTVTGERVAELDCGDSLSYFQMRGMGIVSGIYIYSGYAEDGSRFVGKFVVIR
ncbi:MAG: ligand-binding sensor domain-containing protein [bacterium]